VVVEMGLSRQDKVGVKAKEVDNEVENILLGEQKINYCVVCETCGNTGKCVHKGGIGMILCIVFAPCEVG
jgi:multimeric flavodoxin WrbA